jgi:hypothetical protein
MGRTIKSRVAAQRRVGHSEWGITEKESDLQPADNMYIIDRHGISIGLNLNLYISYISCFAANLTMSRYHNMPGTNEHSVANSIRLPTMLTWLPTL